MFASDLKPELGDAIIGIKSSQHRTLVMLPGSKLTWRASRIGQTQWVTRIRYSPALHTHNLSCRCTLPGVRWFEWALPVMPTHFPEHRVNINNAGSSSRVLAKSNLVDSRV